VLWHCWLGGRKGIRPVKNWVVGCWHGFLSGARCRLAYCMAQLMPLPLTVSCFSKIMIGLTFVVPAHLGSPRKGPLNGCVCACHSVGICPRDSMCILCACLCVLVSAGASWQDAVDGGCQWQSNVTLRLSATDKQCSVTDRKPAVRTQAARGRGPAASGLNWWLLQVSY